MKRVLAVLTLFAALAAACAPNAIPAPTPTVPAPQTTPIPVDLTPAQRAAMQALADSLSLTADQITLVSTAAVDWPDACLGVVHPGMMCIQVITPGFRIMLEAQGAQHEFHTNQDGTSVIEAIAPLSSNAALEAAKQALAQALGISVNEVMLVSSAEIQWPDSCLGMAQTGVACAQMVTPGYVIVLEAGGRQYEYHTNAGGQAVVPGGLALTWHRAGGIAGFCDDLSVYAAGEVQAASCKSGSAGSGQLTADELAQLQTWLAKFGAVQINLSDGAVADSMSVTLMLSGSGSAQPSVDEQRALITWAQAVYARVNSPRS